VLFHYALVDDLIPKEEFEQRVEAKIDECGDLVDEPTAAMMVVGELGRAHVKIRGLSATSSLFSFFGKVIDKTDPRVFDRQDGEKGAVATLLLGDETGSVRVVLWDERAGAADEVSPGDVLEVIGRHPGKGHKEIYALALRKATCRIECTASSDGITSLRTEPVDLDALIIRIGQPRTYTRRDGTTGEMVEALVGDAAGTARIVAWITDLFTDIRPGSSIHITGAKPNTRGEGRAYSLDEKSTVTPLDATISLLFTPTGSVTDQGTFSVNGTVRQVKEPRSFTTRNGKPSWVRNVVISDGSDDLKVVLWGDNALLRLSSGSAVEIYHGTAKPGRFADIELHAGKDAFVRIPGDHAKEIVFEGTVIADIGGAFIDNGDERYLLEGGNIPLWQEVHVAGTVLGDRIHPGSWEPVRIPVEKLHQRMRELRDRLGAR
jgi:replication factor A1